ncbi:C6 finger domain protein [Cadophora sp. DSE1049]|nr:C6 finger domain protein [Cadophora sp. DSE1049]
MGSVSLSGAQVVRKTLRRSRFGCRNCKLRKVKCDEGKPHCKMCISFRVLCNFSPCASDLQPVSADRGGAVAVRAKDKIQPPLTNAVWASDSSSSYHLDAKRQDLIDRYLGRGLINSDDPRMMQINRKLLELAFSYPFLMHGSLAVALAYDRHLNSSLGSHRTLEECYHWSQSTILFNKRMTQPIEAKDKDPIWGTAAAMAILSFTSPEARTPEESWPLKSSEGSDLDWLRMSEGKMSLWHILNPLRPDSLFHVLSDTYILMQSPLPEAGKDNIPAELAGLCCLEDSSTAESNPYFQATHALSHSLCLPDNEVTTAQAQFFMRAIHGHFKDLLREKDPVALLLLYMWYRKASRSIWWIELRARVECPAIHSYLQLRCREVDEVQAFLPGGAYADRWD